jgi:hypothetical protein
MLEVLYGQLKRPDGFVTAFLALALLSSLFLTLSTINYVDFYMALRDLKLSTLEVSPQVRGERLIFNVTIAINNPTSYVGLRLKALGYRLSYRAGDEVRELAAGQGWYSEAKFIQPRSDLFLDLSPSLNIGDEDAKRYLAYAEEKGEDTLWLINCSALLETFTGDLRINISYP